MKNTKGVEIIVVALMISIIGFMLAIGFSKQEKWECTKWEQQAENFEGFEWTEWQTKQCKNL